MKHTVHILFNFPPGNYNFFNILYMGLCVSLMDDTWITVGQQRQSQGGGLEQTRIVKLLGTILNMSVVAILITAIVKLCFKVRRAAIVKIFDASVCLLFGRS